MTAPVRTIRSVRPEEFDRLAPKIAALVNEAYRVEDFFKIGDRTDVAEITRLLASDTFLIAEAAPGNVAGAVYVRATPPRGYFGMLSVRPQEQGSGLGHRLIRAAEQYCAARGCTEVDLAVVNLRAELPPYYERHGYRESGSEPWPAEELHRISRPAHFIIMSRHIEPDAPEAQTGR